MVTRREKIQDRRTRKQAFVFIFASISLLVILAVFGIPAIAKIAQIVGGLKTENTSASILGNDKTPPGPPQMEFPLKFTNKKNINIIGRAEAGSILKLFNNDTKIKETAIDDGSKFSFDITLNEGPNEIYAKAVDLQGNESPKSTTHSVIYDNQAPKIEIIKPQNNDKFFADDKTIEVQGKTEKGSQVTVNDRIAIVQAEGNFSQKIALSEGENTIKIVSMDQAQNKTENEIKVTYAP